MHFRAAANYWAFKVQLFELALRKKEFLRSSNIRWLYPKNNAFGGVGAIFEYEAVHPKLCIGVGH